MLNKFHVILNGEVTGLNFGQVQLYLLWSFGCGITQKVLVADNKPVSASKELGSNGQSHSDSNLPNYPYDRVKINSPDPVPDIDITKREVHVNLHFV